MDDPQAHVTDEEVQWFVAGSLPPERRRALFAHLLSRCPDCLRRTAVLAPFLTEGEEPAPSPPLSAAAGAAYDAVLRRCAQAASSQVPRRDQESAQRDAFLARVTRQDSVEEILAKAETEMLIRPLVDAFLTLSFEERARRPGRMVALALAGSALAASLPHSAEASLYSPAEIADLQARVWGELANAYRVGDKFTACEEALVRAEIAREAGSGDPLLLARLLDVQASLRTDQRRFEEAYHLLDLAYGIYDQVGETHLAGRTLISLGNGLFYDGSLERAASMLRRGLRLLEPDGDPQLLATGRQALLYTLAASGEYAEAAELLLRSGLREALPEPLNHLKVRWLEARIYSGLGKQSRAEAAFREIQAGFIELGADYEAALVRLELAGVLLDDPSRYEEIERLAGEAYKTFKHLEIGQEALRAVRYLQKACLGRHATASLVREVVCFLERFEARPNLRFRPETST
jgi:tetratricopeptide (TPR) repeat protein